jgi:hypothetical protein
MIDEQLIDDLVHDTASYYGVDVPEYDPEEILALVFAHKFTPSDGWEFRSGTDNDEEWIEFMGEACLVEVCTLLGIE